MKKRIFASLLAVLMICTAVLTSCSSGGKTVMKLGNATVDEASYKYWMATYKARYVSAYTDIKDISAYWSKPVSEDDTTTNEEFLNDLIRSSIKSNLAAMALFAEEGLTTSEESKEKVDEYIQELVDEIGEGSRKILNSELGEFGVNVNLLRNIFINEDKVTALYDYYFGTNGTKALTDDDLEEYYEENYVRFVQINLGDGFKYDEDSNGNYYQNSDGSYATRDLTDEERAEKDAKIAEIDKLLADGADIEDLYDTYSENKDYKNGYYFTSANAAQYIGEIITKAFTMEIGEWTKITTEKYGTFYIKRMPLDEGAYSEEANADFFDNFEETVSQDKYDDILKEKAKEIEIDEELLNAVTVANLTPNYELN